MSAVAAPAAVVIPSPRTSGSPVDGAVAVLPGLFVPEASQWLTTSTGRVALDGYSWMQAVHWVAGSGLYLPRRHRSHGPRSFGPTTVRVAQELAELFPCRPGIEYLVRRTGLSERSVEYHLGMLREAGLLAYVVRGTRIRGEKAQASEFARMVPPEFDAALGIRTAGEGSGRRMTGIAEAGRELMTTLATKAARKVRKRRAKSSSRTSAKGARKPADQGAVTPVSDEVRCTPMVGSSRSAFSAGTTSLPPENKLASGQSDSPTPKKVKRGRRKLNDVGRRFQLASELIRQVPWMGRASVPRIAWILREVSDAGWTADQVIAFLDCGDAPGTVHRPSGFLAGRLTSAVALWPTEDGRQRAVQAYRDSRRAEQARHQEWEGAWTLPRSESVRRLVADAFTPQQQHEEPVEMQPALRGIEDLNPEDLADMRATGMGEFMAGDTTLIMTTFDTLGPAAAEHIYGADLVQRARKLASSSSLMTVGRR
ncbi:helix-turn-helix domain-containing protein [Streptomyces sp. H27-G5]|uniref:helix-turn-helix domain-containing protein n=1 Tax=Streptomyces sp. H27-G5 TaxID=2996698 RepID=UPI00226E2D5D|nr:helix-turn-helix domain-containing protein [Streptomyces sp. H27-G5]MCY0921150.1 helix-turn-helix domain-containing protein [Streptomyces sp. H27-G5]